MTLAVLCGAGAGPVDPDLRVELTAALRAAGAREVRVLPGAVPAAELRAIAELAGDATEPVLFCADDLVAHPTLLWMLATEPAGRSTVLVGAGAGSPAPLREERGRLLPATPAAATVHALGAFCLAPADLPLLAAVAERAADQLERVGEAGDGSAGQRGSGAAVGVRAAGTAPDTLLPLLLEAGLVPIATRARLLRAARVSDAATLAAARAAVAAVDEDRARLRLAVKERDDFFTTYAVSSWSPLVTRWAARLTLSPVAVTGLSVLFALAAAATFWQASRPAMIAGAVLLYLGFVLDCVDGQLARYTRRFDAFGGWLDTMADRAKEYSVYAGLAAGADRMGLPGAWPLAIAAMLLQTVRHMTDTWYGALHDEAAVRGGAARPAPADGGTGAGRADAAGLGARLSRVSDRVQADTGSVAYWLKRIVVFPIGERWALIAVLAAVSNGRVALLGVLAWGLLAGAYTLGLRSVRARSMRVAVLPTVDLARHRDDGVLARDLLGRAGLPGPLAFAVLAALTAGGLVAALLAGLPAGRAAAPLAVVGLAVVGLVVLAAALPARRRHDAALDWLVPAALRAAEYLLVVAVAVVGAVALPLLFLLLFLLAMRHYDLTARMEKGAPQRPGPPARLGWDGRVLVLTGAGLAQVATVGVALIAGVVLLAFVVDAGKGWHLTRRTALWGARS